MGRDAAVTSYHVASPRWTAPPLTLALLSDLHLGAPWTSPAQLDHWVSQTNAVRPDAIFLAGDFLMDRKMWWYSRPSTAAEIAGRLRSLSAPLGVWSVMGNHDWEDCALARASKGACNSVLEAFAEAGLAVLENRAAVVSHQGHDVWIVGLGSQVAPRFELARGAIGHHDLDRAFAPVPPGAPALLLAHEPDIFAEWDGPEALQLSGHTHGGQIALFGWRPVVPSKYGARYAYGHHQRGERHLIVSGGLGYSGLPLRLGVPPEIVVVSLTKAEGKET